MDRTSLLKGIKKKFENTFHPANAIAGICTSPTLEQVQDLLEHAEELVKRAKTVTAFANSVDALGDAGEKLAEATESLHGLVEKGAGIAGDVSAACEISDAVSVLNKWSMQDSGVTNEDAAKAFDQLFKGAAHFFKKLPRPWNEYARLFEEIGIVSFYSNMQGIFDPDNFHNMKGVLRGINRSD